MRMGVVLVASSLYLLMQWVSVINTYVHGFCALLILFVRILDRKYELMDI